MLFNKNIFGFAITLAVIALLSVEVTAKKYRYKDKAVDYEEFGSKTAKKDSFVVSANTDGSETIVVELNLGGLGNGELVMVTDNTKDVTVRRPTVFYYRINRNRLVVSDQSHNVGYDSQEYVAAPSDVITFVSTTGRALVVFKGKNTGKLSGSYRRFTRDNLCMKSDLQLTSGSLDCEKDLASSNYASSCQGNIQCPTNFISTGYAECIGSKWRGMCLPGPKALATLDQCPPKKLASCALTDDFVTSIYELEFSELPLDGMMARIPQSEAGRSPTSRAEIMKKMCTVRNNFCSPQKNCFEDYFPSDFNDAKAVKTYVMCARCVNYHHCNFEVGQDLTIFS